MKVNCRSRFGIKLEVLKLFETEKLLARAAESWRNWPVPRNLKRVDNAIRKLYNSENGKRKLIEIFGEENTIDDAICFIKEM